MTNNTKAPERIWLTGFHKDQYGARLGRGTISDLDHSPNPDYPEYIRHDLHLSLVAAAYEDARDKALREALKIIHDEGWIGDTHNRIASLIEKEQTDE